MTELHETVRRMARASRTAADRLATTDGDTKSAAIRSMVKALADSKTELMKANRADVAEARKNGLAAPLLKRLEL